jgi:MFS family permease
MFSSLKVREFRIFWLAMFVSLVGTWVQTMAQGWLVFKLTHSAFLLGLVGFLSYIPIFLFSLAAGVFADRVVKKNLLLATQVCFIALALLLGYLVQTNLIRVWHVMLIAFLNGVVLAADAPARQTLVVEMVGKEHLFNAIALNSAAFNSARIIGPALAGILIAFIGMSGCFYVNALSYLPVMAALVWIKPKTGVDKAKNSSFIEGLKETVDLIKNNQILWVLLLLVGIFSVFGVSYMVLMPIFAQDILGSGAKGLAILMSAGGCGALLGSLNLARLKKTQSKLGLLRVSMTAFIISVIFFSFSRSLILSAFFLSVAGYGGSSSMSLANTMLQLNVPDAFRSRVMAVFMMMFSGLLPLSNLLSGTLAHFFGAPAVVFFSALCCLLFYIPITNKYLRSSLSESRK